MDESLEFFLHFNTLIIKESVEENIWFKNLFKSRKKEGQFNIYGVNNDLILIGKEYYRDDCTGWFGFQKYRPYKVSIQTLDGSEILKLKRDKQCGRQGCFCGVLCCCAVESCHQDILVYCGDNTATPRVYLGRVKEEFSWFQPVFKIYDDDNNEQFKIVGHKIKNNTNKTNNKMITSQSLSSYYQMKIYQQQSTFSSISNQEESSSILSTLSNINSDGDEIGEISKLYSGLQHSLFNDKDNIYIDFPPNSTIHQKSILLGALFLINSLYFNLQSNSIST
ncbi:hypothetical protein RB653_009144 [Dictyostelium firmibasis]|uniref:Phospholipid scramblase n=1 Tax=Dictyostelium firmibasis TaxID=79012 RepID=A0AAN7U1G9_9MYCE